MIFNKKVSIDLWLLEHKPVVHKDHIEKGFQNAVFLKDKSAADLYNTPVHVEAMYILDLPTVSDLTEKPTSCQMNSEKCWPSIH